MDRTLTNVGPARVDARATFTPVQVAADDPALLAIRPTLDDATLARADAGAVFGLEERDGDAWRHVVSGRWHGPSSPALPDSMPAIEIATDRVRGRTIRAFVEPLTALDVGVVVSAHDTSTL